MKTCPQCAEEIKDAARICRFCRYEFEPFATTSSLQQAHSSGVSVGKIALGVCLGLFLTAAVLVGIAVVGSASAGDSQAEARQDRADDITARSDARNLTSLMEACWVETQDYSLCDEQALAGDVFRADQFGSDEGQVEVAPANGVRGYTVVAHSKSGNNFSLERRGFNFQRFCTTAGNAGCPPSGRW